MLNNIIQLKRITEGGRESIRWVIFVIIRQNKRPQRHFNHISLVVEAMLLTIVNC